jgi:hypothetical protein
MKVKTNKKYFKIGLLKYCESFAKWFNVKDIFYNLIDLADENAVSV